MAHSSGDFKFQDTERTGESTKLMDLPLEIRVQIWTQILGDKTIHIEYTLPAWPRTTAETARGKHYICVADRSEDDIHRKSLERSDATLHTKTYGPSRRSCDTSHKKCKRPDWYLPPGTVPETMDLRILRASRIIYSEASHVLLATNMFSIDHEDQFQAFFDSLTSTQISMLRKLHLHVDWEEFNKAYISWAVAPIRQLTGLQTLHLCMAQNFTKNLHFGQMKRDGAAYISRFLHFPVLPGLRTVTVSLTDDVWDRSTERHTLKFQRAESKWRWTLDAKLEFAERFRWLLTHGSGVPFVSD